MILLGFVTLKNCYFIFVMLKRLKSSYGSFLILICYHLYYFAQQLMISITVKAGATNRMFTLNGTGHVGYATTNTLVANAFFVKIVEMDWEQIKVCGLLQKPE